MGLLHDSGVAVRHDGGHLVAGACVAERFGFDAAVGEAILATHERWDGRGRPNALAETEISPMAYWSAPRTGRASSPIAR